MPPVKKIRPISLEIIDENKAVDALFIHNHLDVAKRGTNDLYVVMKIKEFEKKYHQSYLDVIKELGKWYPNIISEKQSGYSVEIYKRYVDSISRVNREPLKIAEYKDGKIAGDVWVFNGFVYEVNGFYSDDQIRLLILEDFDKERAYFEKLNAKFNQVAASSVAYERPRIPENIRIEVWRRDGGRCAKCGSREKLEYDHIVPISKGGSNTARNIELLCEKCNRSKSNNIV